MKNSYLRNNQTFGMEKGKDVRSPNMKSDVRAFLGRRILLPLGIFHLRFLQQRL